MEIDFKKLSEPLQISSIDFRVQSINKGGYATILAYKDARVDMNRLDEVVWHMNWKREHSNDNKTCKVSIWNDQIKEWVCKEDVGVESKTESEKGLASDSFKRACFNWGIGRELYDYPVISIPLLKDEWEMNGQYPKATYNLKLKDWKWTSQFENWKITSLIAKDNNWKERYRMWNNVVEDDWITVQDYIDSMKLAKNSEELKELFLKWQKICKPSELDNFTKIKDEKKKEFN